LLRPERSALARLSYTPYMVACNRTSRFYSIRAPAGRRARRPKASADKLAPFDMLAHLRNYLAVIWMPKNSRARNENVRACGRGVADIVDLHAAVDLDIYTQAAPVEIGADLAQLAQGLRDELLSAESRMHAHHKDHVEMLRDFEHAIGTGLRIDPDRC